MIFQETEKYIGILIHTSALVTPVVSVDPRGISKYDIELVLPIYYGSAPEGLPSSL